MSARIFLLLIRIINNHTTSKIYSHFCRDDLKLLVEPPQIDVQYFYIICGHVYLCLFMFAISIQMCHIESDRWEENGKEEQCDILNGPFHLTHYSLHVESVAQVVGRRTRDQKVPGSNP